MAQGLRVFGVGDLIMIFNVGRCSIHGTAVEGRRESWPLDAGELIVFVMDVAVVGHSASESTGGVRSHRFLLYNRECVMGPYLACQLLVFCKLD